MSAKAQLPQNAASELDVISVETIVQEVQEILVVQKNDRPGDLNHVSIHVYMYIYIYAYTDLCIHICMDMHICMHARI